MNIGNALPIEDKFSSIADIIRQILRRKSILKTDKDRLLILDDLHVGEKSKPPAKPPSSRTATGYYLSKQFNSFFERENRAL
jgi:hypothetical protein